MHAGAHSDTLCTWSTRRESSVARAERVTCTWHVQPAGSVTCTQAREGALPCGTAAQYSAFAAAKCDMSARCRCTKRTCCQVSPDRSRPAHRICVQSMQRCVFALRMKKFLFLFLFFCIERRAWQSKIRSLPDYLVQGQMRLRRRAAVILQPQRLNHRFAVASRGSSQPAKWRDELGSSDRHRPRCDTDTDQGVTTAGDQHHSLAYSTDDCVQGQHHSLARSM